MLYIKQSQSLKIIKGTKDTYGYSFDAKNKHTKKHNNKHNTRTKRLENKI